MTRKEKENGKKIANQLLLALGILFSCIGVGLFILPIVTPENPDVKINYIIGIILASFGVFCFLMRFDKNFRKLFEFNEESLKKESMEEGE